jgi:peptide chain release factor 2
MFLDSWVDSYKKINDKFEELKKIFNEIKILNEINEVDEKILKNADFYSDPASKHILKNQTNLKKKLTEWYSIKEKIEELSVLLELLKEGNIEVEKDIQSTTIYLEKNLREFEIKMILNEENDELDAIVTIHSGAGGTEANDWASMLYRMYTRWAEKKGYKNKVLDFLEGDKIGFKSITFNVLGPYSYGYLKSESGIHRLVRLSPFDANNKRHTSFASVFVLPDIEDDIEIEINEEDLKVETYRSSGAGGQHVNKTDSAVRITHIPTGTVVTCQNERSQFQNKENAYKILKAKLYELEVERKKQEMEKVENSKSDIGWGSQIRSYVLQPYKMAKDLRTRLEIGNVDSVLDGDIDEFIQAFLFQKAGLKIND